MKIGRTETVARYRCFQRFGYSTSKHKPDGIKLTISSTIGTLHSPMFLESPGTCARGYVTRGDTYTRGRHLSKNEITLPDSVHEGNTFGQFPEF